MKKVILLLVVLLGFAMQGWGQEKKISDEDRKKAEEVFTELNELFSKYKKSYESQEEALNVLKQKLNGSADNELMTKIEKQLKTAKAYKDTLVVRQELFKNYNGVYLDKGFKAEEIGKWYKYGNENFEKSKNETTETQVYTYFGKDQVINHNIFKNKTTESEILKNVLQEKGEKSYLGDITIPKDGQEFNFYKYGKTTPADKKFKFKKLDVEIRDGYFYDIRALVETPDGNTHVFTNQVGISLLFYSQYGKKKILLMYKYSLRNNTPTDSQYADKKISELYIKVTDIMGYSYKAGNHYIPHDLVIELPQNDTAGVQTNIKSAATYQIKQETSLEKIVELRTYTDFLALFGESSNGLAQIEGKAKFYLFPYPFRFLGSKKTLGQVEYFPSFSPYVNYSKFEDGVRYVEKKESIESTPATIKYEVNKPLDLIEKRFLTMGIDIEVLKWQHKNAPINISLYGTFNYNLSEINMGDDINKDVINIKGFNRGGGLHFSAKRFNNFGFDYKAELSWFNYKNFNDYDNFISPAEIPVFKNEAEIFYHPNGNPNQAIFTRLVTYNYSGSENNQAFYQFQFGYKFAIGNRTVNQ